MIRAVMDTNVLYSALRSRLGYSFEILTSLREGQWRAIVSNHLIHEYEEVLKRNSVELGISIADIDTLLDAICARAEEYALTSHWNPILMDPDDEPLNHLASASEARIEVTHNVRHLAPAKVFGIAILLPREFATLVRLP